jgi:CBS-domain-containing membrane protein
MNANDLGKQAEQLQSEAAASTIRHSGPTADRYATALERYVQAVAGSEAGLEPTHTQQHYGFPPSDVTDVMNHSVVTAYPGALFKEVAAALARNHIDAVPVIDEDRHVVGVVTASDLLARVAGTRPVPRGHRLSAGMETARKGRALTAKELMTSPAITVTPNTSIADAARLAARSRVRSLPVVDRNGVLVGMVSRGDLVKVFLRADEAILQDIEREVLNRAEVPAVASVRARVHEGIVSFTGTVENPTVAAGLVYRAQAIPGVVAVEDLLERKVTYQINEQYLP